MPGRSAVIVETVKLNTDKQTNKKAPGKRNDEFVVSINQRINQSIDRSSEQADTYTGKKTNKKTRRALYLPLKGKPFLNIH